MKNADVQDASDGLRTRDRCEDGEPESSQCVLKTAEYGSHLVPREIPKIGIMVSIGFQKMKPRVTVASRPLH